VSTFEVSTVTGSVTGSTTMPWILRRARWFLFAMPVPVVGIAWTDAVFTPGSDASWNPVVLGVLAGMILGLQLRHSLAAARGHRPRGWPLTAVALVVLVYVPMIWLPQSWTPMVPVIVASALMLLRGRLALVLAAIPLVAEGIHVTPLYNGVAGAIGGCIYVVGLLLIGGVSLYGAARLILVLRELQATRAEVAGLAVVQERLRVSRDLHDLLGQSLSAISLKGDLALRLLRRDPPAARAEIESLTVMARSALHDIRFVARDQVDLSLAVEAEGAAAVLSAAGIEAAIELDLPGLPVPLQRTLAWAVREAVTNVLRHSQARACSITAERGSGTVTLTIVNDGARALEGKREGGGLDGLAERARALSGTLSATRTPDGWFRLVARFPEEAA
jgi:two-component system sensor histidine kinase DesK